MRHHIIILISALLLCGCSLINEDPSRDCPAYDGSENITLSFQMMTTDGLLYSRTDDLNHEEVGSEYRQFEDGIDMKDCAMFVFAKMEDSTGDEVLLFKNTNLGQSSNPDIYIAGAPGSYTVNFTIAKSRLNDLLNIKLSPGAQEKISLRVLMLANCSSPGTDAQTKWNQINGSTYSAVIQQLSDWTFAMSYIYDGTGGPGAANIYNKKQAPMFGTMKVDVTQDALYYSRFDNRVYMGEMEMLRAIAKVRVVDNIQNKDIDGYPKILSAQFIGSQSTVKQLPKGAADYVNGTQVHEPNIAEPDKELTLNGATEYNLGTIPDSWSMTTSENRKGATWIGYVPEQKIDNINNDVNQGMPAIRLQIALSVNAAGVEETKQYDIPMTGYKGQIFNFGDNILRNHVYTLSVDEVAVGTEVDLTFTVNDWVETSFEMNYTETVTVSQALEWMSGFTEHDSDGNVVIKPWTFDSETGAPTWVPLTARFGLSSPIGATWSVHLISLEGTPDAFAFYNNGILQTSVSGTIDGKTLSDLVIVSLNDEPSELNSAKLQIIVTLGNGTVIEAPVTPSNAGYKNYTIVQNPL